MLQAHPSARILIVGQAPGTAVHKTGIPFNDPSGDRLRRWLGVNKTIFYDEQHIALVPMGFCYPGRGNGGDLPPRPECAKTWRRSLLSHLQHIELTIAVGRYAIDWHLQPNKASTLTEIVPTLEGLHACGGTVAPSKPAQYPLATAKPLGRGRDRAVSATTGKSALGN